MNQPGRTSSGSHGGVHRCHKCGWPYPNPHPSAKHRRSHKKACGTLEGYKLLPSYIASDDIDDNRSDEHHKVADVLESQSNGRSIRFSGSGSMSNRSTDEVFSDAIQEFQDCGCSSDNERGEGDSRCVGALERDLSASLSFKDCSDADSFDLLGYSSAGSQEQSPLFQHSILNLNCQNHALNSSKESLHMPINDRNGSMKTLVPVKLEKEMDECALDVNADQVSKVESYSNGRVEITSATVMTDGVKESRQECTGGLGANIAVSREDTRQGDQKTTLETASTSEQREASSTRENSFQLKEESDDILTSSKHVGGLSSESVDASITSQVKRAFSPVEGNVTVLNGEHAEPTSDVLLVSGQNEIIVNCDKHSRSKDESNNIIAPRIDLLVLDNIPSVENAEVVLGGHKRVKFQQPVTLSLPERNSSMHALEDNSRLEDEPTRTEAKLVTVEEGGATENGRLDSSEVEKGREVCFMKEQESQEIQLIDSFESDSKVSSDVNSMHQVDPKMKQHDDSVGTDDVSNLEKVGSSARIFAEIGAGGLANGLNGKDDEVVNGIREGQWKSDTNKTDTIAELATLDSQEGSNEDDKAVDVLRTSISALDAKSLKSSAAVDGIHLEKSVGVSSESNEVCLQIDLDNSFAKNQSHRSEADHLSVESGSQEDSLEGNCGSSYAVSTMDTESVAEKAKALARRDASPGHH